MGEGKPQKRGGEKRQRVEKNGRRRARLTAVPGTIPDADALIKSEDGPVAASDAPSGPNDERLRREKPPHY